MGPVADVVFGNATPGDGEIAQLQRQLRLLTLVNIVPASPYRIANSASMRAHHALLTALFHIGVWGLNVVKSSSYHMETLML